MKTSVYVIALTINTMVLSLSLLGVAFAKFPVGEFSSGKLDGWKEKSFVGHTEYQLMDDTGTLVLKANSQGSASIYYKKMEVDLQKTPILNWSWKVTQALPKNTKERDRAGDDYSARIYVVYKYGLLPWSAVALNYIWASTEKVGTAWPSPYTKNDFMIPVETGVEQINKWRSYKKDVQRDFNKYLDWSVKKITGVAIMVDSDNTKTSASALFGDIYFSEE